MTGLTEVITLAGKEYEVREPSIEESEKFQEAVGPVLQDYLPQLLERVGPQLASLDVEKLQDEESGRYDELMAIILETAPLLIRLVGSIDRVIELTFLGAPALAEDRARIRKEGRRSEFIIPFLQVLQLNFPLLAWGQAALDWLTTSAPLPGSSGAATASNSSVPSTDSGRKKSRAPKPAS